MLEHHDEHEETLKAAARPSTPEQCEHFAAGKDTCEGKQCAHRSEQVNASPTAPIVMPIRGNSSLPAAHIGTRVGVCPHTVVEWPICNFERGGSMLLSCTCLSDRACIAQFYCSRNEVQRGSEWPRGRRVSIPPLLGLVHLFVVFHRSVRR